MPPPGTYILVVSANPPAAEDAAAALSAAVLGVGTTAACPADSVATAAVKREPDARDEHEGSSNRQKVDGRQGPRDVKEEEEHKANQDASGRNSALRSSP